MSRSQEAMDVFYASNTFDLRSFSFFPSLSKVLSHERLRQIRTLWITSSRRNPTLDSSAWDDFDVGVWENIKLMSNLRELRFRLRYPDENKYSWRLDEPYVLAPMKTISSSNTRLKHVEMSLVLDDANWTTRFRLGDGYYVSSSPDFA